MGLIPGSERFPGEGNCNPLQYSCLGNSMDRGAWWATVNEVTKELNRTWWLNNKRNTLSIKALIQIWWWNQKLYRQAKTKGFSTIKKTNVKGTSLGGKKKDHHRDKKIMKWKSLTSKGKHTIKVGNHLHTKLVGWLKGKSSKIICIHNKQLRDTIKDSNHEVRRVQT